MSHVVEHVLHGAAVGQVALPHFTVGLLPPLALMRVEQEDQLLLNQLPFLGVCGRGRCAGTRPDGIEPNLRATHCCCSADGYTTNCSGLLLLRGLRTERREEETSIYKTAAIRCYGSNLETARQLTNQFNAL